MLSRVLVAMDDSELAERALEYALEHHPEAEITILTVVGEPSILMGDSMGLAVEDDLESAAEKRAKPVHERAREIATSYDTEIDTDVGLGRPARVIVTRAQNYDAVILGSHGGTLVDRLFVGNVAETVFRRSPVPVISVR